MSDLRVIDLFCGCGGLGLGFSSRRGFQHVLAADSWSAATFVHQHNRPRVPVLTADLTAPDIHRSIVRKFASQVDVLIGGPPCQPFSTLGKRSRGDDRASLVDVYCDYVRAIGPRIAVMENVRGIQSMRDESGTDYPSRIKARLEAGPRGHRYGVASATIDLGGFGLAQTRLRWIMVAMRLDAGGTAAAEVIVQRLADGSSKRLRTLRSAIGDLPRVSVCGGAEVLEGPDGRTWFNHQSLKHSDQLIKRLQHVPPEGGLPDVPRSLLTPHLIRVLEGAYGSGGHAKNIYGRLSWSKPCGTIVAGIDKITCGRFVHPEEDRLLTPRECARIQSFPDRFRFLKSLVNSYYLIGNAVPPKAGAAIADAIASFLVTKRRASRRQTQ